MKKGNNDFSNKLKDRDLCGTRLPENRSFKTSHLNRGREKRERERDEREKDEREGERESEAWTQSHKIFLRPHVIS